MQRVEAPQKESGKVFQIIVICLVAGLCARCGLEILLLILAAGGALLLLSAWRRIGVEFFLVFTAPIHRIYLNIGFALKPFYLIVFLFFLSQAVSQSNPSFTVKVNRLFLAVLCFFASMLIATAANGAQVTSLRHLIVMSFVVLGSWILYSRIDSIEDVRKVAAVYLHSGMLTALLGLGLYGLFFVRPGLCGEGSLFEGVTYDPERPWSWPMLQSVDVGSNGYAMSLIPFLFVAVGSIIYSKEGSRKIYSFVVFSLLLANLFFTFSRGGMVAFFAALMLMFFLIEIPRRIKWVVSASVIAAICVSAPAIVELYKVYSFMKGAYSGEGSDLMSSRGELFFASLEVFLKNPLFGVGQGTIGDPQLVGKQSHNTYIELLAENGIFVFAIFMALVCTILFRSRKMLKSLKSLEDYNLILSFVIGLIALLIAAIPTSAITMTLFWMQLAVTIACIRVIQRQKRAVILGE